MDIFEVGQQAQGGENSFTMEEGTVSETEWTFEKNRNQNNVKRNIGNSSRLVKEEQEIKNFISQLKEKIEMKMAEQSKMAKQDNVLIIDRIEGNFAVCEDKNSRKMVNILIDKMPQNVKEGDVVRCENNVYKLDNLEKRAIQKRIEEKVKNLFEN